MIPVMQENFSSTRGDCLAACIASIFEIKLNEVMNFMEHDSDWWNKYAEWLKDNYNCFPMLITLDDDNREGWLDYCNKYAGYHLGTIECGKNKLVHSIVAHKGKIVHNPWPLYSGDHDEFDLMSVEFLVPINPNAINQTIVGKL